MRLWLLSRSSVVVHCLPITAKIFRCRKCSYTRCHEGEKTARPQPDRYMPFPVITSSQTRFVVPAIFSHSQKNFASSGGEDRFSCFHKYLPKQSHCSCCLLSLSLLRKRFWMNLSISAHFTHVIPRFSSSTLIDRPQQIARRL